MSLFCSFAFLHILRESTTKRTPQAKYKNLKSLFMYKELTPQDMRKIIDVAEDYRVDGVLVSGAYRKAKEYVRLYSALEELAIPYKEEVIKDSFFGEIKSILIDGKRLWFDVAYGGAYLSEFLHLSSLLGAQAIIQLGTCGALQENIQSGNVILPITSFGDESSTRMYARENGSYIYMANKILTEELKKNISKKYLTHEGSMITVQAMLAETTEDIQNWNSKNYIGVDMESATTFAVASHFNIPAAAILVVAENLKMNELVTDDLFKANREMRELARRDSYITALKTLLSTIKKR